MAAQVVKRLPEGDEWTYELKFDGYRALIIKDDQRVELRSRKHNDLAGMYPGIAAASGSRLKAGLAVVDGEIVALDAQGSPSFQALQHRGSHPGHQIVFYAFDLLLPVVKRRLGDPVSPAQFLRPRPGVRLLQNRNDLFFRKPLRFHRLLLVKQTLPRVRTKLGVSGRSP
jgi:hypothetical protein